MTGSSSSCHLNDEEIQYLSLLLGIIDKQDWKAFGYTILNNPAVFQSFARTVQRSSDLNGMTILHACVRFDPPPQIVKLLLDLVPESPGRTDCLRRTALHVACGTRASLETIRLLSEAFPRAVGIQDEDGKTPLHLACDSSCELFEGDRDGDCARPPPSYDVIKALVAASPLAVPMEDQDGMSALEHAIFSDAPIKVVKLLQYCTRKQCEIETKKRQTDEEEIASRRMLKSARRVSRDSEDAPSRPQGLPAVICMSVDPPPAHHVSDKMRVECETMFVPARREEFSPLMRRRRGGIVKRNCAA